MGGDVVRAGVGFAFGGFGGREEAYVRVTKQTATCCQCGMAGLGWFSVGICSVSRQLS
jgi:hypothetical protein